MTEEEVLAKAMALAEQHKQEIIEARLSLTRNMVAAGYDPSEWVICDNLEDIQQLKTTEYKCWAYKKNPTKL